MWDTRINRLQHTADRAVVRFMNALIERPAAAPLATSGDNAAFGRVMRRATRGAVMRDTRVQIDFDPATGAYRLGVATPE